MCITERMDHSLVGTCCQNFNTAIFPDAASARPVGGNVAFLPKHFGHLLLLQLCSVMHVQVCFVGNSFIAMAYSALLTYVCSHIHEYMWQLYALQ